MIRVLEQLDVAQSLLERSQHHAKIAAMYEELRVALSAPATAPDEQLRKDAERFVWYESNSEKVLNIGPCWYSRNGYGLPMKRRKGFREAIDAAMKETP